MQRVGFSIQGELSGCTTSVRQVGDPGCRVDPLWAKSLDHRRMVAGCPLPCDTVGLRQSIFSFQITRTEKSANLRK